MTSDASVHIEEVTKRFGEVTAVDAVTLSVRRGELFALLGPSGCGKTTLLRLIGGLETPDSGTIRIQGEDMTRVPPHRRPVNMVFQHYALFPHLTVGENVAFGLPYKEVPRAERAARVERALELVRLAGYGKRRPDQLSGGQRQRVALARALILEPQVLLLDEPLAALDPNLRKEVQVELKHLQRTLGISFVFVTHDREEALALSDRIAVMSHGRVEQTGTPAEVFERPATEFVARFLGASNFFAAEVVAAGNGIVTLRLPTGTVVAIPSSGAHRPGDTVRFLVRPEKLRLTGTPPEAGPSLPVTLEEKVYQGMSTEWIVRDDQGKRYSVYVQNGRPAGEGEGISEGGRGFLGWEAGVGVMLKG
ncbi:MAG TPA: ABC transporter ATP-binding protein [Thermoanaerobaculia bacterium]|nr:ABC transporter ATP-binding protein [Thermoanaerobaculia bacterium]